MFPNFAFLPCSTQNVTFVPCSPGINVISPVSQNPWEGLHYVDVIFSHIEQKKRPIDGRSANKRMVGRKLESGSKVLFDTSGEESILVSEHRGLWDQALCPF